MTKKSDPKAEKQEIEDKVYAKALKFLGVRPHSKHELAQKFLQRGYSRKTIDLVINKLTSQGYIDDLLYAEQYLDSLMRYKILGFYGVKARLLKKGLSTETISQVMAKYSVGRELEIAKKFVNKKSNFDSDKIARGLSARGFRSEVIREVLQAGD